tara:strand:+ start:323 stop:469 length:147 start_codon:yes stop_codon:yes gene_type:complete
MDTVATIFGLVFVGAIVVCLVWTIMGYITEAYSTNNKLEENIKKFNRK